MPKSQVAEGDYNPNGQELLERTTRPGTDHNQYVWEFRCVHCGTEYGANGSDFHHRKCPACQGGAVGIE
jgi:hypothetical protein